MNVNGVGFGTPEATMSGSFGSGNPRLKALEQKLQRLNKDKQEAVRKRDEEKVKKLEEEIEKVKSQIEQLKRKERQKEEGDKNPSIPEQEKAPSESRTIDVMA